jgi:integrase/recombinase XerD
MRTIFFDWCEDHQCGLENIEPVEIAAYIAELSAKIARPSVKQHVTAIRHLFNCPVTGDIPLSMPADSMRGRALLGLMGSTFACVSTIIL